MGTLFQDIRYGARMLAKSPGATAIALITLALGIGVNTATFSMINAERSIPKRFTNPEELVCLHAATREDERTRVGALDYLDWCEQAESFTDIALFSGGPAFLSGNTEPERINGLQATANLLPMLGLDAQLGRLYSTEEDSPAAEPVVVLTEKLWERKFDRSPDILGQTIMLDDHPHVVIGVLPPEFDIEDIRMWYRVDFLAPLRLDPTGHRRDTRCYQAVARLGSEVTLEQAQAEMSGIAARLAGVYPETNAEVGVTVRPLKEVLLKGDRLEHLALLAAVGLVLLIACVNLANLLLAKSTARGREFAVRAALGAGRVRIVRQLLTESMLLALLGGALGLLVGTWTVDSIYTFAGDLPFQKDEVGLNLMVLVYTLIISCVAALLFGVAPASTIARASVSEDLKEGTASVSAGRGRNRLQNSLVVAQLAIALPLFVCCGLTIRHLLAVRVVDFGFNTERLITMRVDLPWHSYQGPTRYATFYREAIESIEAMPGIERAAAAESLPTFGAGSPGHVMIEGRRKAEPSPEDLHEYQVVTPGFMEAIEIPLISGRYLTAGDLADGLPVALINERMARHYGPNEDPVGRRLTLDPLCFTVVTGSGSSLQEPEPGPRWIMIVGVVADAGYTFRGGPSPPTLFLPYSQKPQSSMTIVARTRGNPKDAIPVLRTAIHNIDPTIPVHEFGTVADIVHRWSRDDRSAAWFLGLLAALALGLASLGLYGVMSYAVEQRTHEIGVRIALGAAKSDVLRLVIKRCLTLAALGIAIGLVLSAPVGMAIESLLFGVSGIDPVAYVGVSAMLLAVATLAGYLPARKATRIDPMVALRCE